MNLSFKVEFFDAIVFDDAGRSELLKYTKEFDISRIPPLERRRLSKAARCAFHLTKSLEKIDMPVVFNSYSGEINRCFDLQSTLARGELISPTSFSLSVHNAISSLLSISMQNNHEISAVCAYATLEYALVQAKLHLENGHDRVLVLAYYEAVAQDYFKQDEPSFMVAMIVSKGQNLRLTQSEKQKDSDENLLLKFLLNFDTDKKSSWQSSDRNCTWQWDHEP